MSWILDTYMHCTKQPHAVVPVASKCYSNENLLEDPEVIKDALSKVQNEKCQKIITELWLSECEESLHEELPTHGSSAVQAYNLTQALKMKELRRNWLAA